MSDDPNQVEADAAEREPEERVVPVIEEEIVADTRAEKTGSVRVEKHVDRRIKRVEMPLIEDTVEVRRVPVNRVVTEPPPVRKVGNTLIVPVVQEELVVTKRLVLKEEVHLVQQRTKRRVAQDVVVDRETAVVQRLDSEGRVIDRASKSPRNAPAPKATKGRSLLGSS